MTDYQCYLCRMEFPSSCPNDCDCKCHTPPTPQEDGGYYRESSEEESERWKREDDEEL